MMDQETVNVLKRRLSAADKKFKPAVELLEVLALDIAETLRAATGINDLNARLLIQTHSVPVFKDQKNENPIWLFGSVSPYARAIPIEAMEGLPEDLQHALAFGGHEKPIRMDSVLRAGLFLDIKHGCVSLLTVPDILRLTPDIAREMQDDINRKICTDDQISTELLVAMNDGYGHGSGEDPQSSVMREIMNAFKRQNRERGDSEKWRGDEGDHE